MRAALDALEPEIGRYVRLVNYCSGLCMPEIAAMGAARAARHDAERRPLRHHLPRHQSAADPDRPELLAAHQSRVAGVVINTGEDNYLTTADAVEQAPGRPRLAVHQRASGEGRRPRGLADRPRPRLRDRPFARGRPALRDRAGGSGREIFPDAPLKYMPPTKHMTGNVFRGYQQNTLFALTSRGDGSVDPPARHADRGAAHAVPARPLARASTRAKMIRANARHLREEICVSRPRAGSSAARARSSHGAGTDPRRGRGGRGSSGRSRRASSPTPVAAGTAGAVTTACSRRDPDYANPFMEAWTKAPAGARA